MSEPCRTCGAALAEDQRYCLNCGERRGGPRVDFRRHLPGAKDESAGATPNGSATPPPDQPVAKGPDGERRQRDYAPLAAAGGIAVLGIMLLIGVLIGRGTGDGGGSAAQPSVITVAAEGASADGAGEAGPEGKGEGQGQGKDGGKQKAKEKDGAANGGSGDTGNATVASEDQLKELQEQSPEEYSESSAKLPDEIATPGAPPPTDGKAPGGGSGGTTIE